jgi:hypothetical protein
MKNTLRFLFVGALLASAGMTGCGTDANSNPPPPPPEPDMAQVVKVCDTGDFCTTTLADQTMDLASIAQDSFMVKFNQGYTGTVNVTVQRTALDALSGGKDPDVAITAVPGVIQANATTPQKVSLTVSTTTAAAAFANMPITLHLQDAADATKFVDLPFKLTVNSNLTITVTGDGVNTKHVYSTDNGTQVNFNVRQRPVSNGTGGTNFIFLNKDSNAHIIHGSGKITHQSTAGTGTAPNATYTVKNVTDVMNTNVDGFYCHTHGQGSAVPGVERFVTFIP